MFVLHYNELNGSIRSIIDLTNGLKAYNIMPFFIVPNHGGITNFLSQEMISFHVTTIPYWMDNKHLSLREKIIRIRKSVQTSIAIKTVAAQWKIDLIYSNTSVTPVGRIAAEICQLPHIWHIREFGDLDFGLHYLYPQFLCNKVILSSSAVICHAKAVQAHHFRSGSKKVHLVYNGCATREQFDKLLDTRRSIPTHPVFTFAMLSGLSPRKGQAQAIRVLAALNSKGLQARLVLAGGGRQDFTDSLKTLAVDLGVKDLVEFIGLVSDPYPVYFSADCVLICSEHEAFSRAGLEAMSTALPLIARNSGGSPELMENGKTGILYDAEDELVSAMTRMIQYPTEARQMGLAGWNRAREHFNIEDYAANVYQIIQSVAGKEQ